MTLVSTNKNKKGMKILTFRRSNIRQKCHTMIPMFVLFVVFAVFCVCMFCVCFLLFLVTQYSIFLIDLRQLEALGVLLFRPHSCMGEEDVQVMCFVPYWGILNVMCFLFDFCWFSFVFLFCFVKKNFFNFFSYLPATLFDA